MSLRLVRCPYCGKRFNISGITPGTRLKCGWCTAILTVPNLDSTASRSALSRGTLLQIGGGIAAGLIAAVVLFYFLKPSAREDGAPEVAAVADATPELRPDPGPPLNPIFPPPVPPTQDDLIGVKNEIVREFGVNFIFYSEVKPYLLVLERSELYAGSPLIQDYSARLDTVFKAFRKEFGDPLNLPRVESWMPVIIFNSRTSFDRYFEMRKNKMAASIKGIYEYDKRRVVLYINEDRPFEVLQHEGVHQIVHYYTRRETLQRVPSTYWFQEGLAANFEGVRRTGNRILFAPPAESDRLPILKQTLLQKGRKEFVSLPQLVGTTVDDFWDWFNQVHRNDPGLATRRAQLYYAESWALAQFLRARGDETRKVLHEYLASEISGKTRQTPPKQLMEGLVQKHLGMELAELENEFVDWILNLPQ